MIGRWEEERERRKGSYKEGNLRPGRERQMA